MEFNVIEKIAADHGHSVIHVLSMVVVVDDRMMTVAQMLKEGLSDRPWRHVITDECPHGRPHQQPLPWHDLLP